MRRGRSPRFRSVVALALTTLFVAPLVEREAFAGAQSDAQRVADQWRSAGANSAVDATVTVLPARFLFDDETASVALPPAPPATKDGRDAPSCTTIAIVGARGLSFRARLADASLDPLAPEDPNERAASVAGVVELRRCEGAAPERVSITSDAGRGAVEIVVARSRAALPALGSILLERTGGSLPGPPDTGALPPLAAQDKRADAADARARRDGATVEPRASLRVGSDGGGEIGVPVEAGCHRFELFAREMQITAPSAQAGSSRAPLRRVRLDLDAEIRVGDRVLARDRTEAPDARLETCVAERTVLDVAFVGAYPGTGVVLTRARWPMPERLPGMWGALTRARMARALFKRHVAIPSEDPVLLVQGSSGATPVPLSVEVGGCYLAVVGTTHGHPRQLQLRAYVGARESTDERGAAEEAALTAFCVRANEPARIEVVARGTGIGWGLALFRVKSGVWETGR